jgi:hypothetical protein
MEPFLRHSLHFRYHAYQTGRSVETAFHNLVYEIDRALEYGLLLLGTYWTLRLHLISPRLSPYVRQPKNSPTYLYDGYACQPEVSTGKGRGI